MQTRYKYIGVVLLAAIIVAVFSATNSKLSAHSSQPVAQNTLPPASSSSIRGANVASGKVAGASTDTTSTEPPKDATTNATTDTAIASTSTSTPQLMMPISIGLSRVTKKPFGLYVTPATSPVSDDIFTGYHTGLDFETFPDEQNTDVVITAACDGTVLVKEWAKGYGGVFVQSCKLDGEDVTVLYGHLNIDSITPKVGETLTAGDKIGDLGQGFSQQTDGRRKHLHFDIHKGTAINILGYVPKQSDLANWIDPMKYLQ